MNNQKIEHIKSTLNSLGWKYIQELFDSEIKKFDEPISKSKNMEEIGKEYIARIEAKKKLEKILKTINSFNNKIDNKKVIYK